ncbi:MAG: glycosyltransferase family 2 protein [Candidatus Electrothrix sp. AW2]|nr:glycosyltransferase family 2 protein [Candidatus Electrothrix gigas]
MKNNNISSTKYVIITPVRDEEDRIEKTIQSVLAQTVQPAEWIIVNDGSTDNTERIIQKYQQQNYIIKLINKPDRGYRKSGTGVMEAFHEGYKRVQTKDWEYLVKLDADLSFDANYFSSCFDEFYNNPRLGIGGGVISSLVNNKLITEGLNDPKFHVRGATKIYRRQCWDEIGGLHKTTGWDTIDELKANMLHWQTYSFPHIHLTQLKETGTSDGVWKNWIKNGRANYIAGYHPLFMMFKVIKRCFQKPYGGISSALAIGYFSLLFKKAERVDDEALIRYVRQQQINRLLFKKSIWTY